LASPDKSTVLVPRYGGDFPNIIPIVKKTATPRKTDKKAKMFFLITAPISTCTSLQNLWLFFALSLF